MSQFECTQCGLTNTDTSTPPIILDEYMRDDAYPKEVIKEKYGKFCSRLCVDEYKHSKDSYDTTTYVSRLLIPLEMCTFCGNYTHPTEFCAAPPEVVAQFDITSYCGHECYIYGEVLDIDMCPNMKMICDTVNASCDMFNMKVVGDLNDKVTSRCHLITSCKKPAMIRQYVLGPHLNESEIFPMCKQLLVNYTFRWTKSNTSRQNYVLHFVKDIGDIEMMFLPFSILEDNCCVPVEEMVMTHNRTSLKSKATYGMFKDNTKNLKDHHRFQEMLQYAHDIRDYPMQDFMAPSSCPQLVDPLFFDP
jgi:hypothetical protein